MVYFAKLVERYRELKAAAPGCLLLMQVGSFMQVQDDDARGVAKVTGLKLEMAGEVDAPVSCAAPVRSSRRLKSTSGMGSSFQRTGGAYNLLPQVLQRRHRFQPVVATRPRVHTREGS